MNFISNSRLRKMKKLFRAREYAAAREYADKLNPAEITTAYDLSMMADVYVINKDLESAKVIYKELYRRNKSSRNLKTLIDASIKCGDIEGAIVSLRELIAMDDSDIDIYIFQYRIGKITNQSDDYLIKCLQKVRELDYIDVWALALAKLYFKVGMNEECLKECKNIKLWFPETSFEHKAQLLEDAVSTGAAYEDLFGDPQSEEKGEPEMIPDDEGYAPLAEVTPDDLAEAEDDPLPQIEFEDEEIPRVTLGEETLIAGGYDGTDIYDDDDDDDCDEFGNVIVREEPEDETFTEEDFSEAETGEDEVGEEEENLFEDTDGQLEFRFDLEEEEAPERAEEPPVDESAPDGDDFARFMEETGEDEEDDDAEDEDDDCDEFGNVIFREPEEEERILVDSSDASKPAGSCSLAETGEDEEPGEEEEDDDDDDDEDDDCDEFGNVIFREPEKEEFSFEDEFSDEVLEAVMREEKGEASGEEVDESISRMLRGNK